MWKHKTLGFTVTNVEFIGGWAVFISNTIETFLHEDDFRANYEKC